MIQADMKSVVQIMQLLKDERGKSRSFSIIISTELVHWYALLIGGASPTPSDTAGRASSGFTSEYT